MKMYFVDYENINGKSLKPTLDISRGDIVFIFYTNACRNISDSTIKLIGDKGGFLKTFKVKNGVRNALDFQLSSYIGYIISKNFFANYKLIIVSGDKGYDVVCDFWRKRDINIQRIDNYSSDMCMNKNVVSESELSKYLNEKELFYKDDILEIINTAGNTQKLYAKLGKLIRNANFAGIIYKKIKPLFLAQLNTEV